MNSREIEQLEKKSIHSIRVNNDLKESNINFKYTYDEFCVEFLNETLENIENIDIFNFEQFNQFYINFWNFNLYTLQSMLNKKIDSLGYKFEDFFNTSKINKI